MPGKNRYGRITALPQGELVTAAELAEQQATLTKLFGSSPILSDDYDLEAVAEETMFSDNVQGDPALWPDGVDQTFSKSPDIPNEVLSKTGGAGRPGTPFTPNLASPGEGNGVDPATKPDTESTVDDVKPGYVQSANTENPSETRQKIVDESRTGNFTRRLKFV